MNGLTLPQLVFVLLALQELKAEPVWEWDEDDRREIGEVQAIAAKALEAHGYSYMVA